MWAREGVRKESRGDTWADKWGWDLDLNGEWGSGDKWEARSEKNS